MRTLTDNSEEITIEDNFSYQDKDTNANLVGSINTLVNDDLSKMSFDHKEVDENNALIENENLYSSDFSIDKNKVVTCNISYANKSVQITNFGGVLTVVVNGVGYTVTENGLSPNNAIFINGQN